MANTIEPNRPSSFLAELAVRPLQPEIEIDKPIFVGGIVFNEGKDLLVLGEKDGKLLTGRIATESHKEFITAMEQTGRVIPLNSFHEVNIRQVDLEGVEVKRSQSIYKHAPLSLNFQVRNPENGEIERVSIGESDLLDIFTGGKGGIAVFSGKGYPEETGLLFERANGDNKQALVLFFHPSENPNTYNSVVGLGEFLYQVNEDLAGDIDIDLQTRVMSALRKYEEKGKIDFGSKEVRKEIFSLQTIALARKAAKGDTRAESILEILIPQLNKTFFKNSTRVPYGYQDMVDQRINSIIVDFQRSVQSERQEEIEVKDSDHEVHTDRAKMLLTNLDLADEHGADDEDTTEFFLTEIAKWINTAKTVEEFDDLMYMVEYFFSNDYITDYVSYSYKTNNSGKRILSFYDKAEERSAVELKTQLEKEILKRRPKEASAENNTTAK